MDEEKRKFRYEIIKILIDKLLVGVLIAVVGFTANFLIEKYKARESFYMELNSIRVSKLAEVWEKVYLLEDRLTAFFEISYKQNRMKQEALLEKLEGKLDDKNYAQREKEIDEQYRNEMTKLKGNPLQDLSEALKRNRFWIDQDFYIQISEYVETVKILSSEKFTRYPQDTHTIETENKKKKIAELESKLEKLRIDIMAIRNKLFIGD